MKLWMPKMLKIYIVVGCILLTSPVSQAAVSCGGWNGKLIGVEFVATNCNASIHVMTGIQCTNGVVSLWSHQGDWAYGADLAANYYASQGYRVFRSTDGTRIVAVDKNYSEAVDGISMGAYATGTVNFDVFDKVLYPQAASLDADNDGYLACDDCNDNDPAVNPGASEICGDGKDNDCNLATDCADQACVSEPTCCTDADGDGFSIDGDTCGPIDCNDNDPDVYPGASEICDGKDNNCNGQVDENLSWDIDGDGYNSLASCVAPADCNDSDPAINPGATEICDLKDNNCNGQTDEGVQLSVALGSDRPSFTPQAGESIQLSGSVSYGGPFHWTLTVAGDTLASGSSTMVSAGWNGKKSGGQVLPPGNYTAILRAQADDGPCQEVATVSMEILPPSCKLNRQFKSSLNVASGNLLHSQSLFASSGGTMPLSLTLSYESLAGYAGALGQSWSHNFDISLKEDDYGNVVLRKGLSGKGYSWNGSAYVSQLRDSSVLSKDEVTGEYLVAERSGRKYSFDATGRVVSIQDPDGNTTDFSYPDAQTTVITDPIDRTIRLYDDDFDGLLDRMADPAGSIYNLTYHPGTSLLWQVISPEPTSGAPRPTWTYTYNAGFLETKTDPEGYTVTYVYKTDGSHQIDSALSPDGTKNVAYNPATQTTTITQEDNGVWSYVYDSALLLSESDPYGHKTGYVYYGDGRTLCKTVPGPDPTNLLQRISTCFTYDSFGNILTETVPMDIQVSYGIDPDTLDQTTYSGLTPAPQVATRYTYDYTNNDRILSISDERGAVVLTTGYAYTTEPDVTDPTLIYDVVTLTDPTDEVVSIIRSYHDGRLKDVTDGNGQTASYSYDANGYLASVTQPSDVRIEYFDYDQLGNARRIEISEPGGTKRVLHFSFDALGRLIRSEQDSRDALGNPLSYVTEYGYDRKGNRTSVLDPEHAGDPTKAIQYLYDHQGQVTRVTDALDNFTEFEYGSAGCASCGGGGINKLTGVVDANHVGEPEPRIKTSFLYNLTGTLRSETDPMGFTLVYSYTPSGRLWAKYRDLNGNKEPDEGVDQKLLSYTYYLDGSLHTKADHLTGEVTTFTYDANGRMDTADNNAIGYTFAYYNNGRLQSVTDSNGRVIRYDAYDGIGQRDLVTLFPGTADERVLDYDYDGYHRLKSITTELDSQHAGNEQFIFGYDDWSRRDNLSYPNGVNAAYTYNDDTDWLTGINYPEIGVIIGYPQHDKVGNRKQRTEDGVAIDYAYDDTYQLTQAKTGDAEENYVYDKVGNRESGPTVKDTVAVAYQHDDANRMLHGRKFGYAYDDRGNRTRTFLSADQSKRWEFSWDGENKLTKAELIDGAATLRTVSFKYDPFGRRVEKKVEGLAPAVPVPLTTTYIYDGEDIVLQLESDGTTTTSTQFIHGPGIDEPLAMVEGGQSFYYHADGLGSIVAISDSAKNIVARYSYDAFGNPSSTAPEFGNAYAFTGREWDREIGLYYYRARYYDSMEGRFISKDPIGFAGGDWNVYGYVLNNPINATDPYGKWRNHPRYGNWCGAGWSGGGTGSMPPVDCLDKCCMAHDKCYERGGDTCECNRKFVDCMYKLPKNPLSWNPPSDDPIFASFYRSWAIGYYQNKQ